MSPQESVRNDYDSPWKEITEKFFREFIQFFFPNICDEIDWSKPYEFLDTQLEQITGDAEMGKRIADKLVKVCLNDGSDALIYLHIEIQGYRDIRFESRMFVYNRRIREKFNKEVVSLAILCDDDPNYRPHDYSESRWGCDLKFSFPIVKLLDYRKDWANLEQNDNVFSIVVMAHLKSIEVKQGDKRKQWKMQLVRSLYCRGWDRAIIIQLFRFVDWVIALPKDQESEFWDDVKQFEKERAVQYVTTGERIGHEKGIQQGMQQEGVNILRRLLIKKFGAIPEDAEIRIEQADSDQLLEWSENVLTATTVEDVFH